MDKERAPVGKSDRLAANAPDVGLERGNGSPVTLSNRFPRRSRFPKGNRPGADAFLVIAVSSCRARKRESVRQTVAGSTGGRTACPIVFAAQSGGPCTRVRSENAKRSQTRKQTRVCLVFARRSRWETRRHARRAVLRALEEDARRSVETRNPRVGITQENASVVRSRRVLCLYAVAVSGGERSVVDQSIATGTTPSRGSSSHESTVYRTPSGA